MIRRIHLIAGLVLLAYVAMHLLNLSGTPQRGDCVDGPLT